MTISTDDLLREVPTGLTPRASTALDGLIFDMLREGWKARPPNAEVGVNDKECAERRPCWKCKGELHYEPFVKGRKYRAFTVCVDCGNVREF